MPSGTLWFICNFLASEALEALIIIVIVIIFVRFFPHKVKDVQRLAGAFFRLLSGPKAAFHARDAEDAYGVGGPCGDPKCLLCQEGEKPKKVENPNTSGDIAETPNVFHAKKPDASQILSRWVLAAYKVFAASVPGREGTTMQ